MKRPKELPRGIFVRDGAYWIYWTDQHGRRHREKAGTLLETAKACLERRHTEKRQGKFFPETMVQPRSVLFGELSSDYLEQSRRKKRSWRHDETRLKILGGRLRDVPVVELGPGQIEGVLGDLAELNGWSHSTQNRYRTVLSGLFRLAIKNRKATSNPIRETEHLKEPPGRVRYLNQRSDHEEADLFRVIRESWPEWEPAVLVALHTGMRRSEQFRTYQVPDGGLRWEYIDFRAGVIYLPQTKSGKARSIPMNAVVTQVLRSLPRVINSPYVFQQTDPGKFLAEAVEAAGIQDFTWHSFRHTFASRLAMAGVPMRHIADLMGHSEIQTTMRYAHLAPAHLARAVELLATTAPETATRTATGTATSAFGAPEKSS
jgi:integrase